ncbi:MULTISPECIES: hypothetical protein [unclassified Nostoc]|uniref:hypothetical protein n=1 Tax=unclassified Nostoc TaxID=2593658 RepID=UPI001D6F9DC4|nr:hypothetical protein [Nostoc sp. JL23]MBN3877527.1 hypothetical protein [Nostoc sp. JL23]
MPNATDPRGCPGIWQLYDNWSGHPTFSGLDTYTGYELDNPTWTLNSGSTTVWSLLCVGTDNRSLASASINDPSSTLYSSSKTFVKDDPSCTTVAPSVAHDCINGACTPKTTYGTPGLYPSLSECEVACGTGCSGKCISNSEWAQVEGLANQLKNRNCG